MTDLPAGWAWAPLGDVVDVLDHLRVPVNRVERAKRDGPIPYYGATGQVGWIDEPLFSEELCLLGEDGAPFLDVAKAKAYVIDGPSWVNNHAHVLRALGCMTTRFLKYALDQVDYRPFVTGTTRAKLTKSAMSRIPIPVPPLAEQRRIVAAIEVHLSLLDGASSALRQARQRSRNLRRAILTRAVTEGEERSLGDLLDSIEAGRSFGGPGRPAAAHEWGVIKVSAMTWGRFMPGENKTIPTEDADQRWEIRAGDLLVSRANTTELVGAAVLVGETRQRLLLSDKSLRLVVKPHVDKSWLLSALSAPQSRQQISEVATGTSDSMRNISQDKLRAVVLRVPSPQRQAELACEIASELELVDVLANSILAAERKAEQLRSAILARAFRGELVQQDPDDESSSVLLERIESARAVARESNPRREPRAVAAR